MGIINLFKLSTLLFAISQILAAPAIEVSSPSTPTTVDVRPTIETIHSTSAYSQAYDDSQTYSISPKHIPASGYSSSQVPVTTYGSSSKNLDSSGYKLVYDTSKQAAPLYSTTPGKQTEVIYGSVSTNNNYPYVYTLAKPVSPATAVHATSINSHLNYDDETPEKYQYGYRVTIPYTGTEFGHSEVHDGHTARGYYHVLLPDGRLQNVKYWAGPSGYHATITYESKY